MEGVVVAAVCPLCKETDQVLSLSGYWGGLPPGSANYDRLRQPAAAEVNYLYAAGVALMGVGLLVTGAVLLGVLVLAGGVGWGVVMSRLATAAEEKRAAWGRSKWCGRCAETFVP